VKLFVLGDEEAVLGFSLAGVSGQVAQTPAQVKEGLEKALNDSEIGILLITADAAQMVREEVDRLKITSNSPLILEIPSSRGTTEGPSIRDLVRQAIGVGL
jgi:V/A-type H+-transporting ATPase subunit F